MGDAACPTSLAEAVELLAARPELRPLAGCTDLMVCEPVERAGLGPVIDLLGIPEISRIGELGTGGLEIGATTTFTEIQRSTAVRERYPALAEAASAIGAWQIQNRATLGGNIANASPAGDSLPVLLALDATVIAVGADGKREIPYREFHTGYRETALKPGELIGWIRLPRLAPGTSQLFRKVGTREAQAISKVVVCLVGFVKAGRIEDLAIGAGSVAATPVRLRSVENELNGAAATLETAELGGKLAAEAVEPIDDVRSTAAYRRFALGRIVRRLLLQLVS